MAKILKLEAVSSYKKVLNEDADFSSLATILMDEIYSDFANIIRMKLLNNNVSPTKRTVSLLCEEVDDLMGDMTVSELIKEIKNQDKRILLDHDRD